VLTFETAHDPSNLELKQRGVALLYAVAILRVLPLRRNAVSEHLAVRARPVPHWAACSERRVRSCGPD
jgi:hypothetical protein